MRMSCNGCRVLRKGCNDNCSIRPCLEWIKTPDSQANATLFLAKFYGRAGLINLINAGPEHLRPAIFRSLLYEACGRNVNPIYGSVGLLWSDNWSLCQNAVDAVLNGAPITQIGCEAAEGGSGPVPKHDTSGGSDKIHRVSNPCRFKRTAATLKTSRSTSHESALSHLSEAELNVESESREAESLAAGKDTELHRAEPESGPKPNAAGDEIGLELTLGFEPVSRSQNVIDKRNETGLLCNSSDD